MAIRPFSEHAVCGRLLVRLVVFSSKDFNMFYGWEDFKRETKSSKDLETSMPLFLDTMESTSDLRELIEAMSLDSRAKDVSIAELQREIHTVSEALKLERAAHAETRALNKSLSKSVQEDRIRREERDLEKRFENEKERHDKEMADMKSWYEIEMHSLVSLVQTLEDAEERLCAQLGDLEVEAMDENRRFNSKVASLSQSLAHTEKELSLVKSELQTLRQGKLSLKEMETMDLAAQLSKCKHECDRMKETTALLQGELEKKTTEVELLTRKLTLVERHNTGVEKLRRPAKLCRSDSLSLLDAQRNKNRPTAVAV